jgi:thiamine-monophosphate kinase
MTEHVDFNLAWATGADIGFKLVAINVSDIAAMGGRPTRAVATIQVRDGIDADVIEGIARGMAEAASRWDVWIVGGDIGRGSDLALTLTLLGDVDSTPVLRSGARPGDLVCVTGALGGAAAGLVALKEGAVARDAVRAEIETGSAADGLAVLAALQLRPTPRLAEGRALAVDATAMIDISDGLALDLRRLCVASEVGCDIYSAAIPLDPELDHARSMLDLPDATALALIGGEDFELLFTIPEAKLHNVQTAMDEIGTGVSVIGKITDGAREIDERPLDEWSDKAWDHLRTR